jgi:hypothetical protein
LSYAIAPDDFPFSVDFDRRARLCATARRLQAMNGPFPQTYELYLDDDRYAVPTLHLIPARDEARAVEIASRLLAESPHHRGAELCQGGERIAVLGATRQAASEAAMVAQG